MIHLLLSNKSQWTGMRLTNQIWRDENFKTTLSSPYKKKRPTPTLFQPFNSPKKTPSFPPLRMQTETNATTKMSGHISKNEKS